MLNSNTSKELVVTQVAAQEALKRWFNDLQQRDHSQSFNGRVWRAELRRTKGPYEALTL